MTSIWMHFTIQNGIESREAKTNAEKQSEFWLSPEGRWFNVPSQEHEAFASHICKIWYGISICDLPYYEHAGEYLIGKHHWLKGRKQTAGEAPRLCLTDCDGDTDIDFTPEQYVALKDYYGDKPVYLTWTIRMLWEKSRPKAKAEIESIWRALKNVIDNNCGFTEASPILTKARRYFEATCQTALANYVFVVAQKDYDGKLDWPTVEAILHIEYDLDFWLDTKSVEEQPVTIRSRIVAQYQPTIGCPHCKGSGESTVGSYEHPLKITCPICKGTKEIKGVGVLAYA